MNSPWIRRVTVTGALVAVGVGGLTVAHLDKAVDLSVDGETTSMHVFGSTVADALDKEGITVGAHDLVVPAVDEPIADGQEIVVKYGRKLTLNVDGETREYYTTATTLDQALSEIGLRGDARLSASRSEPLGRTGLALNVYLPKAVTMTVVGDASQRGTTAATVAEFLNEQGIVLGPLDQVTPELGTTVTEGMSITVVRVEQRSTTGTQSVPFNTVRKDDASLTKGTTTVQTEGAAGQRTVTYDDVYVNGQLAQRTETSSQVTAAPTDKVVLVGTKPAPAPAPARSSSPSSSSRSTSSSGSTPSGPTNSSQSGMWDRIAQCESGGRWNINTGNGYYGGLQFNTQTWLGAGGGQYAPRADLATREQQITIANRLYASRGLQPWACAGAA